MNLRKQILIGCLTALVGACLTCESADTELTSALEKLRSAKTIQKRNAALSKYLAVPLFRRNLPENGKTNDEFKKLIIKYAAAVLNKNAKNVPVTIMLDYKTGLFANIAMAAHDGMPEAVEFLDSAKVDPLAQKVFSYVGEFMRVVDERKRLQKEAQAKINRKIAERDAAIKRLEKEPLDEFLPKLRKAMASDPLKINDEAERVLAAAVRREDYSGLGRKGLKELDGMIVKALRAAEQPSKKLPSDKREWSRFRLKERVRLLIGIHSNFAKGPLERLFLRKLVRGDFPETVKKTAMNRAKMFYGR